MSMTREEAVPHYLSWREAREAQKAGKAIQFYNLFGDLRMWQDNTTECAIGDWPRDKDRVYRIKPGQAPTPRPVPPGTLTLEEAKAAHAAGKDVQWYYQSAGWRDQHREKPPGSDECDPIVGWRLKPGPELVPLGPEDVPPGSVVKPANYTVWRSVLAVWGERISIVEGGKVVERTYADLLKYGWQISTNTGKTWRPCSKEVAS